MKKLQHLMLEDIPLPLREAHFVLEYCKDLDIHRAAEACGLAPEEAFELRVMEPVMEQIKVILQSRLTVQDITPDWLMQELYNLHHVCLQKGRLSTSLQTLKTIGALGKVDAYAAEKVELKTDRDIVDRLTRSRKRQLLQFSTDVKLDDDEPSFL